MYKRATKQCSNDVKKKFNYIAKERKKLKGILSNGKKKGVNGKPDSLLNVKQRNGGGGEDSNNRLKKEWVTKLAKNQ